MYGVLSGICMDGINMGHGGDRNSTANMTMRPKDAGKAHSSKRSK